MRHTDIRRDRGMARDEPVCVCVCVRERERESKIGGIERWLGKKDGQTEKSKNRRKDIGDERRRRKR